MQCERFPAEPSKERQADPWRRGEETWLETEVRLFGAAMRTAFNRLAEGLTRAARRKASAPPAGGEIAPGQGAAIETTADRAATLRGELKRHLQWAFGLNSRYADDAILKANEVITSQQALIPVEIEETEAKRKRTERKHNASLRKAACSKAERGENLVGGRCGRPRDRFVHIFLTRSVP